VKEVQRRADEALTALQQIKQKCEQAVASLQ
jgi:hypothetical protein